MKAAQRWIVLALASCGFLTYGIVANARKRQWRYTGAGLIGTIAGLFSVNLLPSALGPCLIVMTGVLFLSVSISDAAESIMATKDDQRIVIDEWAGYLASIAMLPKTPVYLGSAFVLFRLIDTTKPAGLNAFARLPGGWGVVMDDFVGGLIVNAVLHVLPLH